jgi:hypothetical protein
MMSWNKSADPTGAAFRVGQLVQVSPKGKALVDFPGNPVGPLEARSLVGAIGSPEATLREDLPVLLVFENGDPTLPIIIGVIGEVIAPPGPWRQRALPLDRPQEGIIDGKKIVFDAKEEIVLRCGKSSVTLKKDGKIVILGAELVSRASGANKIKGATVKIN